MIIESILFAAAIAWLGYVRPGVAVAVAAQAYLVPEFFAAVGANLPESVGALATLALLGGTLARAVRTNPVSSLRIGAADVLILTLTALLALQALNAPNPWRGLQLTMNFLASAILLYAAVRLGVHAVGWKRTADGFLVGTLYLGLLTALLGLAQWMSAEGRLHLGDRNPIPASILLGAAFITAVFGPDPLNRPMPKALNSAIRLLASAILGVAFILTNTRGTALALLVTVVCAFGLARAKTARFHPTWRLTISVLAVGGVLAALTIGRAATARLREGLFGGAPFATDPSVEGRTSAYAQALQMFLDSPLVGHGTGSFLAFHFLEYPHNLALELLAEQGIIGLALVSLLLGTAAMQSWHHRLDAQSSVVLLLLTFGLLEAQVSMTLWMHKFLWIPTALLASLVSVEPPTPAEGRAGADVQ